MGRLLGALVLLTIYLVGLLDTGSPEVCKIIDRISNPCDRLIHAKNTDFVSQSIDGQGARRGGGGGSPCQ